MILFSLKIKTSRPPQFRKGNMRSVQEIQSAFMRMDVNGDGSLTKREMLAADEFTPEEVNQRDYYNIQKMFVREGHPWTQGYEQGEELCFRSCVLYFS